MKVIIISPVKSISCSHQNRIFSQIARKNDRFHQKTRISCVLSITWQTICLRNDLPLWDRKRTIFQLFPTFTRNSFKKSWKKFTAVYRLLVELRFLSIPRGDLKCLFRTESERCFRKCFQYFLDKTIYTSVKSRCDLVGTFRRLTRFGEQTASGCLNHCVTTNERV